MSQTETGVFRTVSRLNRMLLFFAFPLAAYTMMMGRNQTPSDEADLVNRARQGDDDAFAELFARYYWAIFRYLAQMVHSVEDAHDLAAFTFIRAWYSLPSLQDATRFRSWLYTIAKRVALDFLRQKQSQKHRQPEPLDDHEDNLDENQADFEEMIAAQELMMHAIQKLPPKEQQCLLLYTHGFPTEDIAHILDITPGSVGTYLSNARKKAQLIYKKMRDETG